MGRFPPVAPLPEVVQQQQPIPWTGSAAVALFALPSGDGAAALQNACPHAGVGLSRGDIDEIDIEDLIPAASADDGSAEAAAAGVSSRTKLGCVACPGRHLN